MKNWSLTFLFTNLKIMPNSRNAFVSFANRAQALLLIRKLLEP